MSSSLNIAELNNLIASCLNDIRDQENTETELIALLQDLRSDADIALFEGSLQSVPQLQNHLYETRRQMRLDSVDLRDMIKRLSKIDFDLAKDFNAIHVFRYNWLMYNIAQTFGEVAGGVPHPSSTDPDICRIPSQGIITEYQDELLLHERKDKRLADILLNLSIDADGATFNGTHHSVNELLRQLYGARLLTHLLSVVIQDAIDIYRVFEPSQAGDLDLALGGKIKSLVNRLANENNLFSLFKKTALLNCAHITKNRWLIYKYSQKFGTLIGNVPHPGTIDPFSGYTQQ
ncbi:hypothetical protein BGX29_007644 [Mortierella sp. GBA35]|nr:hypothetical protein BGX29_007644 [Mortierella sp. GBA35]